MMKPINPSLKGIEPAYRIDGKSFIQWHGDFIYGWYRNGVYLYIGATSQGVGRWVNHSVINNIEPFLETDEMHIWVTEDNIFVVEEYLNNLYKPKYSVRPNGEKRVASNCLRCGEPLKSKRSWQKYCSVGCRTGAQSTRILVKRKQAREKSKSIRPLRRKNNDFV